MRNSHRVRGIAVSTGAPMDASNLIARYATTVISTTGTVTLRSARLSDSYRAIDQHGGVSSLDMTVTSMPVLSISAGSAEFRGRYVGSAEGIVVSACAWLSRNCSVDAAHVDWGDALGPLGAHMVCGVVMVSP